MTDLPIQLEQLIAFVDEPEAPPLHLVTDAVVVSGRVGELGDALVDHFVQRARAEGASWAEIGHSMGVSKQAAQKRFVTDGGPELRRSKGGLFTRFDRAARSAVQNAVRHAHEEESTEITTVHLALGLADRESGPARLAISELSASAGDLIAAAPGTTAGEQRPRRVRHLPFTDDCKKVLELSLREAIRVNSRHIGSEHILLGLLRDEKSEGARLLAGQGVTHGAVEAWLEQHPVSDH